MKCPGLRYISRPLTYRLCQNEVDPHIGCCVKCLAWPINLESKQKIKAMVQEYVSTRDIIRKQVMLKDYETTRMIAHFETIQNIITKALHDAYAKGNLQLVEKILAPVASEYGDVDVGDVIDLYE